MVETETYGYEFMVSIITTEQILELRTILKYLGVPIIVPSYMFGDNNVVVNSSSIPQ